MTFGGKSLLGAANIEESIMKKQWLTIFGAGCMVFGAVSISVASTVIPDGLVAAYEFSGNANDSSGSGNDANVSNAALTTDRFGNENSAYSFNGTNAFIQKGSPVNLNIGDQSWTISAWVNQSADSNSGPQMIVDRYECGWAGYTCGFGNYAAFYRIALFDGVPRMTLRDDHNNYYSVWGSAMVSDSLWHHVVGVLDRHTDSLSLFVDGSLDNTASLAGLASIIDSGSPLEIGRTYRTGFGSPHNYFNGLIDDVFIYDRALSASEVSSLYTTSPVPIPASILLFGAGMAGLFGMGTKRKWMDIFSRPKDRNNTPEKSTFSV